MSGALEGYAKVPAELPEARILRLEPGDIIALRVSYQMSDREYDELSRRCKNVFPDHRIVVFERMDSIDILRPGGEPR